MIRSGQPRGVVLRPSSTARNKIFGLDGQVPLTIVPDKSDSALDTHFQSSETFPRFSLMGRGEMRWGEGSGAPGTSATIGAAAGAGLTLTTPVGTAFTHAQDANGNALDGGSAEGFKGRVRVVGATLNGINGNTGGRTDDSIYSDVANVGGHSAYALLNLRNYAGDSPSTAFDDKGSFHQLVSELDLAAYVGGGALTTPFGVAATNVLTKTTHGLAAGDPIQFTALTGGTGLSTLRPYFVIASGLTANDFKISTTVGGAEVDFTTNVTAGTYERIPYSEALNLYATLNVRRKGSLCAVLEAGVTQDLGSPARTCGVRMNLFENNPLSTYGATNFGAGSGWTATGMRGFEVNSSGTERVGTGFLLHGTPGFESAFRLNDASGSYVGGFDGNGGVITKVKADTFADGDFRVPTDGLVGLNSSANDLEYRSGGTWRGLLDKSFIKQPCRAASVANVNEASPGATIDGVSMSSGDRVLLKDQTTESENGIWVWNGSATPMTRARDADEGVELRGGSQVGIEEGTKNKDTVWLLVTNGTPTIGSSTLRFSRTQPAYARGADLDPWATGSAISETFQREHATTAVALVDVRMFFAGGCVIPANRTVTNISMYCIVVGTAYVDWWWAIIRQSDRACLQRTANSTSLMTINAVNTRALQATYTAPVDVPVYIVIGFDGGTVPQLAGTAVGQANLLNAAPILAAESNVDPTSTPPAVGATLAAPGVTRTQNIYAYLT